MLARRTNSADGLLLNVLKKLYYFSIGNLNKDLRKIRNCTGYGIFGREIHDQLKQTNQQSPFLRGLIAENAGDLEYVDYHRPKRKGGHSSATFFRLWEEGVGGFINNSMIPIRFVTIFGLVACILAVIAAFTFLVLKLIYWGELPNRDNSIAATATVLWWSKSPISRHNRRVCWCNIPTKPSGTESL